MRCIASFTLLAALATTAACTDPDPYMAISDTPGSIAAAENDATEWSSGGNVTSFYPAGASPVPSLVTLRIEGRSADGDVDVNDPLDHAELAVIDGAACRISAPLRCMGGICFAELELTQPGLCMVRATGATRDGVDVSTCWYRGTWPAGEDPGFAAAVEEMTANAYETCLADN